MSKHIIEFFIAYIFLPYSMTLYFFFTGSLVWDVIKGWLKALKEKRAAKNKQGEDTK